MCGTPGTIFRNLSLNQSSTNFSPSVPGGDALHNEDDMSEVFVYGGSFNPPGVHHARIVERLISQMLSGDHLLVIPCGDRPDKLTTGSIVPAHRAEMARLAFAQFYRTTLDLTDLERDTFTRTADLINRVQARFPEHTITLVVGQDLIEGGGQDASEIQQTWYRGQELWDHASFLVLARGEKPLSPADLPPQHRVLRDNTPGSSSAIRRLASTGQDFRHLVTREVYEYIVAHQLYRG